MVNSTVPKYSTRHTGGGRQTDPEAQSTSHMLSHSSTRGSNSGSTVNPVDSTPEEQENEQERKQNGYSGLPRVLDFFWGGVYAPGSSTHDPIEILLNTEDPDERDRLTEQWRDNRLNELSFVGVVVR